MRRLGSGRRVVSPNLLYAVAVPEASQPRIAHLLTVETRVHPDGPPRYVVVQCLGEYPGRRV
jgi:hypothetical protein